MTPNGKGQEQTSRMRASPPPQTTSASNLSPALPNIRSHLHTPLRLPPRGGGIAVLHQE
ncbi:hypothetical protein Pfo_019384 [Paulownia fortunei]|nr:hypothetical protein Pfo_019384 [Paulownia fortunei]